MMVGRCGDVCVGPYEGVCMLRWDIIGVCVCGGGTLWGWMYVEVGHYGGVCVYVRVMGGGSRLCLSVILP